MTESLRSFRPGDQPEDDAAREARHQLLATLLGAYADGELPAETASQIDAHLLGCGRCRSELKVQQVISERLSRSSIPAATSALHDRIRLAIAAAPVPVVPQPMPAAPASPRTSNVRRWLAGAAGAVALIVLAVILLRGRGEQLNPAPFESTANAPAVRQLFAEYRRVSQGDLPGRARDLESVRRSLPFPVTPVTLPDAHLVAAWTTDLDGDPAAVLAYRWHERVVLQFIVGEGLFFRARELRTSFASRRAVVAQDGEQGLIAWPEAQSGSVLIGDLPWRELIPLSTAPKR